MTNSRSSDDQIRMRLLRTLGIDVMAIEPRVEKGFVDTQPRKILIVDDPLELPLKYREESSPRSSRIQFNTTVTVVPIPSHSQYSNRIKKFMWSNSAEIRQNAQRNIREFAAEGWNWEKVLEEDEMYHDKCSNELIHPVHLGGMMDL
jgi:hypothetical protein